MAQKWTDIQSVENSIIQMRKEGRTRQDKTTQEIVDALGLVKVQIKNWINRYNRRPEKNPPVKLGQITPLSHRNTLRLH